MKKQERIFAPSVGGASLLVIFGVLCLCIFSLLCLSTVLAEKRMAEASLESAAAYYRADLQAQEVFARLRGGESVSGVQKAGNVFTYSCEISGNQQLMVQLQKKEDTWQVLRWQAVALSEEADEVLPVWDGT